MNRRFTLALVLALALLAVLGTTALAAGPTITSTFAPTAFFPKTLPATYCDTTVVPTDCWDTTVTFYANGTFYTTGVTGTYGIETRFGIKFLVLQDSTGLCDFAGLQDTLDGKPVVRGDIRCGTNGQPTLPPVGYGYIYLPTRLAGQ